MINQTFKNISKPHIHSVHWQDTSKLTRPNVILRPTSCGHWCHKGGHRKHISRQFIYQQSLALFLVRFNSLFAQVGSTCFFLRFVQKINHFQINPCMFILTFFIFICSKELIIFKDLQSSSSSSWSLITINISEYILSMGYQVSYEFTYSEEHFSL